MKPTMTTVQKKCCYYSWIIQLYEICIYKVRFTTEAELRIEILECKSFIIMVIPLINSTYIGIVWHLSCGPIICTTSAIWQTNIYILNYLKYTLCMTFKKRNTVHTMWHKNLKKSSFTLEKDLEKNKNVHDI